MADKKLSELTETTTGSDTMQLFVNDGGVSKRITRGNFISGAVTAATTTYSIKAGTQIGGAGLELDAGGAGSGTDTVKLIASGSATVARTDADTITIGATNTTYVDATTSVAGLMSTSDKTKIDAVESAATADQTGAEIKTAYEAETNAFTDTQFTKLSNIATTANNYTHPNHSGDVVSVADGATTIQAGAVDIAMLSATGTASGTTFLRGDNTWVVPTDTNTDTKWDGGTTGLTAATGRTSLGLVIGTNVQAYDATIMVDADIGSTVGYLNIPKSGSSKTASYTLATTDIGELIEVGSSGSITIPNSTFSTGDVILIFNNTSGDVTITCSITTSYIGGTDADDASITLATRGICNVLFISGTVCVVTGNVS